MRNGSAWLVLCAGWLLAGSGASAATLPELVAAVSQANVTAHIAALEGDRATPAGQAAAAAYIRAQLESYGYGVGSQGVGSSENLVAEIRGIAEPDEIFVLGAHFDAVPGSPGADDNASGVAVVLEVARVLANQPLRSTLHFLFFALEEQGFQGSEAYAGLAAFLGANVTGMISLDLVAYTCHTAGCQVIIPDIPGCVDSDVTSNVGDFIGVLANTASASLLSGFLASATGFVPALPVESLTVQGVGACFPDTRRSDHKSFWDVGYPAILLTDGAETRNPNYHLASDTLATLDLAFTTQVARAVLAYVATVSGPVSVPALSPRAAWLLAAALPALAFRGRLRRASKT